MKDDEFFYVITDDRNNVVNTNVGHLITCKIGGSIHQAPPFKFNYQGHGPNELAANMLFLMNVDECTCVRFAVRFRDEVMHKHAVCEGENTYVLFHFQIKEWLAKNNIHARTFG